MGVPIERVSVIRDLGFLVSSSLDFSEHWIKSVSKANSMIYLVFKVFSSKNPNFYLTIYRSHIRSLLEYGTPVTNTVNKKGSESIEKVQRSFTRKLYSRIKGRLIRTDHPDYLSYDERLDYFGLEKLSSRRQNLDLKFLHRILMNKTKLSWENFFNISKTRSRSKFSMTYKLPKKKIRSTFFVARTVPLYIRKLRSLSPKGLDQVRKSIKNSLNIDI
jgi:hypothetical protein